MLSSTSGANWKMTHKYSRLPIECYKFSLRRRDMFILSVKAQNLKFIAALAGSVAAVALVVTLIPGKLPTNPAGDTLPTVKSEILHKNTGIRTNEDRVGFLKSYGWEVEDEAREVISVTVPENITGIYEKYNELQKKDGFDLAPYRGKTVKRYSYLVTNYEHNGTVLAGLLMDGDKVIAGDISAIDRDGFLHGLTKGNDFRIETDTKGKN